MFQKQTELLVYSDQSQKVILLEKREGLVLRMSHRELLESQYYFIFWSMWQSHSHANFVIIH